MKNNKRLIVRYERPDWNGKLVRSRFIQIAPFRLTPEELYDMIIEAFKNKRKKPIGIISIAYGDPNRMSASDKDSNKKYRKKRKVKRGK